MTRGIGQPCRLEVGPRCSNFDGPCPPPPYGSAAIANLPRATSMAREWDRVEPRRGHAVSTDTPVRQTKVRAAELRYRMLVLCSGGAQREGAGRRVGRSTCSSSLPHTWPSGPARCALLFDTSELYRPCWMLPTRSLEGCGRTCANRSSRKPRARSRIRDRRTHKAHRAVRSLSQGHG